MRVYVAFPFGSFVDLTLSWYGGEQALVDTIGEAGGVVNFRVRPCCCCIACPKQSPLTRKKVKVTLNNIMQLALLCRVPYSDALLAPLHQGRLLVPGSNGLSI